MMISLHCHHQAAGFRLHRSLVEMKGERGRLETLVGMRGVSLMWNAFRRYRYCYCSSPLLPPCLSVSVCVCMSMSVFVSQSVSCCCTEDLATGPVWAQCHLTGYSMYSLLSASWLYLFFSLLLSVSLLLFTTLFCFKFFFFFCKHISPSLSVCRVQILQTGIIPCLLQGLWLSLCWSCLRSKIFLHWKAVV